MNRPERLTGPHSLRRRDWLAGVAAWLGGSCSRSSLSQATDQVDDEEVIGRFQEKARAVGITTFRTLRTRNFLAVGNAVERFLRLSLQDCEAVALDYLESYRARGFDVAPPGRRLTIAALDGESSYTAFVGKELARTTGALYNRTDNYLVLYDYRNAGPKGARSAYLNLRSLAHEATHQLTFNTGLLNRRGDVPKAIVEGFGTFGEVRKIAGRSEPGQINAPRLEDLAHSQRSQGWIPVATLLTDDTLALADPAPRRTLFYAESWLLVHYHMKEPARLPAFRAYLKAIHSRDHPAERLNDARTHLGDLDRLDADLRKYGTRLVRALP